MPDMKIGKIKKWQQDTDHGFVRPETRGNPDIKFSRAVCKGTPREGAKVEYSLKPDGKIKELRVLEARRSNSLASSRRGSSPRSSDRSQRRSPRPHRSRSRSRRPSRDQEMIKDLVQTVTTVMQGMTQTRPEKKSWREVLMGMRGTRWSEHETSSGQIWFKEAESGRVIDDRFLEWIWREAKRD